LANERRSAEHQVRELLSEHIPFALAPKLRGAISGQFKTESAALTNETIRRAVQKKAAELHKRLAKKLPKQYRSIVHSILTDILTDKSPANTKILHKNLTEADRSHIDRFLKRDLPLAVTVFRNNVDELARLDQRISEVSRRLAMAPSDLSLDGTFRELESASEEIGRLTQQRRAQVEDLRRKTWSSIDIVRKLKRLEERIRGISTSDQAYTRAQTLLEMLDMFAQRLTRAKVEVLRKNFITAFARLARKEDLVADARIDPESFSVTLIDKHQNSIPKERLSAGEKQIYAIAMLEALAKTSGRNLPVIIDTPLGRLDSKHRRKLVEQYFPHASHQVIVLSTDTEVDEPFYLGLSKHVSHAYHLQFDESTGATRVDEGYFWRSRPEDIIRAA
jgi:DNA sulfur modification protein DndD